jgi:magnesium transporter
LDKDEINMVETVSSEQFRELFNRIDDLITKDRKEDVREIVCRMHPADIAEFIDRLDENDARKLFELLDDSTAAKVLVEVEDASRENLLEHLQPEQLSRVVDKMHSDDAADILGDLDPEEASDVLSRIEPEDSADVRMLMKYPEDTAGGIMATEFVSVNENLTIRDAIETVRTEAEEIGRVIYVYAVDSEGKLKGVLPLPKLVLSSPDALIKDVMIRDIVSVREDVDQEKVGQIIAKYNLHALPVVDSEGKIIGIVTVDDVIDIVEEEATEDILRLVGTNESEILEGMSSFRGAVMRMPWLLVCFFGELVTGFVLMNFESVFSRIPALVFFIPLIAAMGGNVGMQSSTIMIRGMATGDIDYLRYAKRVFKELFRLFSHVFINISNAIKDNW